jgi:hypothetical protein
VYRTFVQHTRSLSRWALCLAPFVFVAAGCNSGADGRPAKKEPASKTAPQEKPQASPGTPRGAYEALQQEILAGNFIALYDFCAEAYVREKFSAEKFRAIVTAIPGFADLGITAEDVSRMKPREVMVTYFRLFPKEQKEALIVAMSRVRILGETSLPDGRVALDIDSDSTRSRLFWIQENGEWRITGEEMTPGEGK